MRFFSLFIFVSSIFLSGCQRDQIVVSSVPIAFRELPVVAVSSSVPDSEIFWKSPEGWEKLPDVTMRLAGFKKLSGAESAELTISAFPGDVGTLTANVNRWRAQMGLAPVDEAGAQALVRQRTISGHAFQVVTLEGASDGPNAHKQLHTAMLSYAGKTWFFKMSGDAAVVQGALPEFEQVLVTLEFKAI
ncbi:MAG: hypothetical protein EXS67_03625 [Candidatus Margulisbacteria bacterium]|nr:hypothetical protein [Candidatus Margulisiibacteriota bacterium]